MEKVSWISVEYGSCGMSVSLFSTPALGGRLSAWTLSRVCMRLSKSERCRDKTARKRIDVVRSDVENM